MNCKIKDIIFKYSINKILINLLFVSIIIFIYGLLIYLFHNFNFIFDDYFIIDEYFLYEFYFSMRFGFIFLIFPFLFVYFIFFIFNKYLNVKFKGIVLLEILTGTLAAILLYSFISREIDIKFIIKYKIYLYYIPVIISGVILKYFLYVINKRIK